MPTTTGPRLRRVRLAPAPPPGTRPRVVVDLTALARTVQERRAAQQRQRPET